MMCKTESEEESSARGGLGHPSHHHSHSRSRSSNAAVPLHDSGMVYNKWMMRQSSQNSSSSSSEKLVQAKESETKFLASLSVRGALDPYVRNLCNNVRDLYESIILADHAFAEAHNVEQSLWHLHYRQIEDFRHRVSSIKGWSVARNGQASSSLSKERWTDLLQKEPALTEFKNFLVEASGFYHELIPKLRARCGLSPDLLDGVQYHESKSVELKRCQQSCYRCLVNLGDYARYKEFYVGNDPASYDFSIAADFYRKAISHWPVDGQPHNQLAVLAVYVGDELLAVYHYFRSLAVEKPFPTTRENLTILFDKNRVKYEQLPAAAVETVLPLSNTLRRASEGVRASRYRAQKPAKRGVTQKLPGELINCFFVRFVRLNGLLFTKTSLEKFEEVFSGMLHDLEQLLELDDKNLELLLGSGSCIGMGPEIHGAFGALKLVVILICTVENVKWGSKYTEALQQDVLFRYAFTAFLGIMGRLVQRCAEANDASSSPLLPAILVFLEWLACRPEMVQGIEAGEEQSNLLSFFWKQCVTLLNRFCGDENCKDVMDDSLEETSLEDSKVGVALWEDFELQGFSPLAPAHVTLLYAERPNGTGTEIKKDEHTRLHRLLATGKAIVSMVEGSGTGMLFNEDLGKFHLSGEMLEKKPYDESHGIVENKISRPVDGSSKVVATKSKEECAIESSYNKQACGDDEDEELIVFQPVLKEQPILAPSGSNSAASEPLNDSASPFWKGGFSNGPSMRGVIVSSVPDVSKSILAMKPTCLSNAIPMFGDSLPQVESCPADSTNLVAISTQLKDLNLKGNPPASYNPASRPLFAQNWPDQTMMPPMQFVNGIESSSSPGFKKAANSLGVIGQPKQLQTCMLETIDGLTSHGLDGSYKLAYEKFNGASQYGALPFTTTLNSSSQKQPPPPFMENLNEEVQGKIYAGTASKLVESAAARTSTPTQKPQSLTSAVICPPPGFGPQPMKPAKKLVHGEGKVSNQQVGNEQPKLDDYCWLDDYKASTPTSNHEEKHKVFPGSSNSTYSLWSSDNNRTAQSGGGTFFYPPLMQLSHQEKKRNPAAQLQQQPLQKADDKETWSLFGPAAPFHWTSTIFS